MIKNLRIVILLFLSSAIALAKTEPSITMLWPSDKPALKLTFTKFHEIGVIAGQKSYVSEVTVENLTDKTVPRASFTVYLMDKENVRIGDGLLQVSDLPPSQAARVQFQFSAIGIPSSLTLVARKDMLAAPKAKTVALKVISTPPGAELKVDGTASGFTPTIVNLTVGMHNLELSKDGYAKGTTPVEITSEELPGGSVTIELGGLSRDSVELRDGTVLLGDVISMSLTAVVVRVDGKDQTFARNLVRKMILVEREVTQQPPIVQPVAQQPQ